MINTIEVTGLIAGVCTSCSMLPQLIKTLKERSTEDISIIVFVLLLLGTGLWTYYGFLRHDWPIIITNGFSFTLNLLMLILKIRYSSFK